MVAIITQFGQLCHKHIIQPIDCLHSACDELPTHLYFRDCLMLIDKNLIVGQIKVDSVPQRGIEPLSLVLKASITTRLLRTPDCCHIHNSNVLMCLSSENTLASICVTMGHISDN